MKLLSMSIYKFFLLIYIVIASVMLGGVAGFLVIYPFLQILFGQLGDNFQYDQMIHNFVYAFVMCAISYCFHINWKRYIRHIQTKVVNHI
jgi:biotin transporter BioY